MSSVAFPSSGPRKKRRLILKIGAFLVIFLVMLFGAAFVWWTKVLIPQLRRDAEQHWAAIGRPMSEFVRNLNPVQENESLQALVRDLQPFGVQSFYKTDGGKDPNTVDLPPEVIDLLQSTSPADEMKGAAQNCPYLDKHVEDLSRLYQGLLRREPPVWTFTPADGLLLRAPSYLTARKISQLVCADAYYKLEHGNEKGAAEAVAAGLKMTGNLGEQPILVSQMIRVAIEGLFAPAIARLLKEERALEQLSKDVEASREGWRKGLQSETWVATDFVDYLGIKPYQLRHQEQSNSLIQSAKISLARARLEVDLSRFVTRVADQVKTSDEVRDWALSDLGISKMQQTAVRYAPILTANSSVGLFTAGWDRAWIRLNAILLLREQAELIRATRSRVQAGESGDLGDQESIVIPGAKWHIVSDTNSNSASFQLTPSPSWTADTSVPPNLFLLPLDGSKSWTFRKRPTQPTEARVATR